MAGIIIENTIKMGSKDKERFLNERLPERLKKSSAILRKDVVKRFNSAPKIEFNKTII
ncbi:hypothetical protein [Brochothrix thermosphacta]|uniref:hypothetical protein n=1 Tax=Brochothrix thermosphacta TaxID=2756 RepID=UPI00159F06AB|nr:hypothetical protein [Brochothrix thermosphacta]